MKKIILIIVLINLLACSSQRIERRIESATMDALADESYLRWGDNRLAKSKNSVVVSCYQGKAKETLEVYKKQYKDASTTPHYWLHIGNCYFTLSEWDKADFFYRMALDEAKSESIKSIAYNNIALIYFKYGQWDKGREALKSAQSLSKHSRAPKFNLSQLYLQFGFYDLAIELLNDPVWQGQQDLDVTFSLANAHLFKGDLKQAGDYFKMIPAENFKREDMASTYALYLLQIGEIKTAKQVMEDRHRSGIPDISAISNQIEGILSQRMKGE